MRQKETDENQLNLSMLKKKSQNHADDVDQTKGTYPTSRLR
jgi:hypothetical protein